MRIENKDIFGVLFIIGWIFFVMISLLQIIYFSVLSINPTILALKAERMPFIIMLFANLLIIILYSFLFIKLKKESAKNKLFKSILLLILYIFYFWLVLLFI